MVETCEQATLEELSGIAHEAESDTIYAIDRVSEELLLEHFERDPGLAAASGKVFRREGSRLVEEFMIDEMVAGQFKLYRREAFAKIDVEEVDPILSITSKAA